VEVGVEAVGVELTHGVAAAEDGVAVVEEGAMEGALPDEGRLIFVHSRRVAVVGAHDVAEEGARGFVYIRKLGDFRSSVQSKNLIYGPVTSVTSII